MNKINVLIADDHKIFRDGIKALLDEARNIHVVGEAGNGDEVLEKLRKIKPDVVLMDINMPNCNGIQATKTIRLQFPKVKVLALTMYEDDNFIVDMMDAGASGYILKNTGAAELINAIRSVAVGDSCLSKEVSDKLMTYISRSNGKSPKKYTNGVSMTEREKEVLKLIAEELSNREIAKKLFISLRTVDTHRRNMMQKLKLKNTASLVKYAIRKGMVEAPSKELVN